MKLSFTKLNYFKSCPRKYRLRYVDKIPEPASLSLISGTAIHGGAEYGYNKIKDGTIPEANDVVDFAVNKFESELERERGKGTVLEVENADKEKDIVSKSQRYYFVESMLKKNSIDILDVEKEINFTLKNENIDVVSKIDLLENIDSVQTVTDIKTSAKKQSLVLYAPQVVLYSAPLKVTQAKIEYIVKKKDPELQIMKFKITQDMYNDVLYQLIQIHKELVELESKDQLYWYRREGYWCNSCWYKSICFGGLDETIG